jgi:tetratricopeptide (TPR) repeat protein
VARFESERQALALMDHPNIAHVYEAGTSDRGRPYFVMEYVAGVPITQYCDQHFLNTHERLELFGQVCLALQHAHQKGVIHRDIKPSNVLVTEQDGEPFPKVIDFGIAKATDQRLAEFTAFTLMGNLAGTPEYMSPEQADLSSQDIDTTTDVYSLGVLLYELLVGALPYDGRWLREAGLSELLRIIREEEAPTPSAKLTKLGDTVAEIARYRRTDPASLRRQLAGDLNWIVMKALEKDRRRRYASVSELAADIRRHLEEQPVLASPPGKLYRARKFVRRHKVSVSAGLLVALSLVAGLIAVAWEARVAESRRRDAEAQRTRADGEAAQARTERSRAEELAREANAQRSQAEAHRQEAEAQRRDAEELFGGVRDLANSMIFNVADQIAELQGATAARETLVRKAVTYLDRLSKDPRATPELRMELAKAYLKIGELQGLTTQPNLGDRTGAFQSYARSVALLEPLVKVRPHDPALMHLLIESYRRRGAMQEEQTDYEADIARSIALAEIRVAADPKSQETRHDLASSLATLTAKGFWLARPAAASEKTVLRARTLFEELVKEGAKDPDIRRELAWQYRDLGNLYKNRDSQRSLKDLSTAIEQFASLAQEYPANAVYRREHAATLVSASQVLQASNRTKDAIEYCKRAIALQQQVVDGDARNAGFRLDLVYFQVQLASVLMGTGSRQEGMDTLRQALAVGERLLAEQPDDALRYQVEATNRWVFVQIYSAGLAKSALEYQRKAEAAVEDLVRRHPGRAAYGSLLAQLHVDVAQSLEASGDRAGALGEYRQALAEYERLAAGKDAGDAAWGQVALGHRWVGRGLAITGDRRGMYEEGRKAIAIYTQLVAAHPEQLWYRASLSSTYTESAGTNLADHNWSAVIENATRALPFLEENYAADPAAPGRLDSLAYTLSHMAQAYTQQGDFAHAIEIRRRLVRLSEQFASLNPSDPNRARHLAEALRFLGWVLRDSGDHQGCISATLQGITILDSTGSCPRS